MPHDSTFTADGDIRGGALGSLVVRSTTPRHVARDGIRALTGERVREAMTRGRRVRLVASASRAGGVAETSVRVEELAEGDPLAQLRGMSNALFLDTDLLGRVGIVQLDGGLTQTAYALLSDLVAIRRSSR